MHRTLRYADSDGLLRRQNTRATRCRRRRKKYTCTYIRAELFRRIGIGANGLCTRNYARLTNLVTVMCSSLSVCCAVWRWCLDGRAPPTAATSPPHLTLYSLLWRHSHLIYYYSEHIALSHNNNNINNNNVFVGTTGERERQTSSWSKGEESE